MNKHVCVINPLPEDKILALSKSKFKAYMPHHMKKDLMRIAKSIDPGQSAQSDHSRNFLLLADFLCINPLPGHKF